jgi:phosphatidylinositol alpha-1,6-mannosyltransferase
MSASPPRLLVVTPDLPPERGGIQAFMGGLIEAMERFRVRVVARNSPGAREHDRESGWDVLRVPTHPRLGPERNVLLNAAALADAARFRPDAALHAHIVTSPAAIATARLLGAPHLMIYHANEIAGKPRLAAFASRHAEAVMVVSGYTERLLLDAGGTAERLQRISPGVTLPDAVMREPGGQPTILTIARLADAYKGHDVLVEALPAIRARVPDVRWVVVGEGPLRPSLEAHARAAGVADAVSFLGSVSDAERDAWLARSTLFAMPSRLPGGGLAGEGFGIVFLEAAAHGLPVVAGNVGGAVDSVSAGETGLLVDPTDAGAVADAICSLLLDPERARALGEAGAARARSFAWPVIAERVEDVLLGLIAARREGGGRNA